MQEVHHRRHFSTLSSSAPVECKLVTPPPLSKRSRKRSRISAEVPATQTSIDPCKRKRGNWDGGQKRKKKGRSEEDRNRRWVFSPRDCSGYKDRFVIVSYNILGVGNASKHVDLYNRVPPQNLNWDWRKKLICKELNLYMPGILCFQEVDRFDDLADLLHEDGFKGVYKGRTGEACDGCAIFWREELFTLLHQEDLEFRKFGLRDNVAQLCVLKMNLNHSKSSRSNGTYPQKARTTPSRSILVGNIHVLFNPNRGDIKLGQIRLFLETAHRLSQEWGNIPVIIAGDLNSMPQSAIYQFLASSELDILMYDRRKMSGQIECPSSSKPFSNQSATTTRSLLCISNPMRYRWSEEEIRLAAGCRGCTHLQHHLKLHSAYIGVPGDCHTRDNDGEPLATSYHSKFMGTVDYIWHSEDLVPVAVVETLPINILRKTGGLPSEKWGSDHLALVCELAFADNVSDLTSTTQVLSSDKQGVAQ
ncbi:carbon catabolite repressor protein 4 homolog 5 isoform X2 [Magnolia sinica]|uniref:carbon catabolite repressor protein 4 homolog 5 isoform X2 n=1 Tax=Magnolia sinica TaxID=86752 RepID=UPI0026587C72|nr:carbon catabolite repressor protein 4 homolog 5 isoform X2 [Magnolia sinica]